MIASRVLNLWHLTSMAVVWSLGFAWVGGVRLPAWVPALLALTVWAVYVADRVLDARAGLRSPNNNILRERHFFHWRYRRILLPLAGAAACAVVWLILNFMPVVARERNSMLAAAALVYFMRVHAGQRPAPVLPRIFSKELLVGLLFTCGCALPALARAPIWPVMAPVGLFAVLAWLNCRAIDAWEGGGASAPLDPFSIAASAGAIGVAGLAIAGVLLMWQPRAAAMIAAGAASALLLALLDGLRGRLAAVTLRAMADLVLLTPAVIAVVGWVRR